jgi:pilus assembly protein CpaF
MLDTIIQRIATELVSKKSEILNRETIDTKELERAVTDILNEYLRREREKLTDQEKSKVIREVVTQFAGFGKLEELLKDSRVTEIMVNGPAKVYVERLGRTELSDVVFNSEQEIMSLVYKILSSTRRRVDESSPFTEVSLKDGSRVNIIIPPLALNGPTLTIRKFLREIKAIEDLIGLGTLNTGMAEFLVACIKAKVNIIFSGATGSGKTTTLNVLSSYIANEERIITIEDTAELKLSQEHVVRLEVKQSNIEGKGEINIRDLFKNSLRMRPDRIIIGEIRGAEALEMLQAICSGHRGSLAIIHGNSPQDVIYRIETMILTSGLPISIEAIHRQVASAIHLVVQQEQLLDGSRKITHISQINGLRDAQVALEDIFVFENQGADEGGKVKGAWRATGVVPAFYRLFAEAGVNLPKEIFTKS